MLRFSSIIAAWLLLCETAGAFSTAPLRKSPTTMQHFSSAPSDSAALDDAEDYSGYGASTVRERFSPPPTSDLLNLLAQRPLVAEEPERARINELIVQLEQARSNQRSTSSPLFNGVWELKYVGGYSMDGAIASPTRQIALFLYSGGYSPGVS